MNKSVSPIIRIIEDLNNIQKETLQQSKQREMLRCGYFSNIYNQSNGSQRNKDEQYENSRKLKKEQKFITDHQDFDVETYINRTTDKKQRAYTPNKYDPGQYVTIPKEHYQKLLENLSKYRQSKTQNDELTPKKINKSFIFTTVKTNKSFITKEDEFQSQKQHQNDNAYLQQKENTDETPKSKTLTPLILRNSNQKLILNLIKDKRTPITSLFVPFLKIHNCPYLSIVDTNKVVLSCNYKNILTSQQQKLKEKMSQKKVYEFQQLLTRDVDLIHFFKKNYCENLFSYANQSLFLIGEKGSNKKKLLSSCIQELFNYLLSDMSNHFQFSLSFSLNEIPFHDNKQSEGFSEETPISFSFDTEIDLNSIEQKKIQLINAQNTIKNLLKTNITKAQWKILYFFLEVKSNYSYKKQTNQILILTSNFLENQRLQTLTIYQILPIYNFSMITSQKMLEKKKTIMNLAAKSQFKKIIFCINPLLQNYEETEKSLEISQKIIIK